MNTDYNSSIEHFWIPLLIINFQMTRVLDLFFVFVCLTRT